MKKEDFVCSTSSVLWQMYCNAPKDTNALNLLRLQLNIEHFDEKEHIDYYGVLKPVTHDDEGLSL